MTKKDYVVLASAVLEVRRELDAVGLCEDYRTVLSLMEKELCRVLKADNARFDAERFLKACRGE